MRIFSPEYDTLGIFSSIALKYISHMYFTDLSDKFEHGLKSAKNEVTASIILRQICFLIL